MEFDKLRAERRAIVEYLRVHSASVLAFRNKDRAWFRLTAEEPETEILIRHKSTTASCIESLTDCPDTESDVRQQLIAEFAGTALSQPQEEWESEGAAPVYCRVRTLPALLKHASLELLTAHADALRGHLDYMWERVSLEERAQGVREATPQEWASWLKAHGVTVSGEGANSELASISGKDEVGAGYPPHAFHTYWAIRCVEECRARGLQDLLPVDLEEKMQVANLWTREVLALQTALIQAKSEQVDGNQLAWALAAQFLLEPPDPLTRESAEHDVYRAALAAFFAEQSDSGAWPLYQPLFHYPNAGNAYCFSFETLTALLRPSLSSEGGRNLRELLAPHLDQLLLAWHFARRNERRLPGGEVGWTSGHHVHRLKPEAWATAMTFSFLQGLRRLLGSWARESAAMELQVRPTRWATSETGAYQTLRQRGRTWASESELAAGARLAVMFVHPINAYSRDPETIDPDTPLLREDQARSAILFGPPGTGKTTLAECIAGSIGWDFLELHASDFLREGMDRIPKRADRIFQLLMELDHCVVLFDEIDELLRERQGESDPFGRFLTTSMLPKLAQLWEQRRILFFVATNDIRQADKAIRRSQRFDALVFVAPPSLSSKLQLLEERLGELPDTVNEERVEAALTQSKRGRGGGPWEVLALLRHDQLPEFAERVEAMAGGPVRYEHVEEVVRQMFEDLRTGEWQGSDDKDEPAKQFQELRGSARRDRRNLQLIRVDRPLETPLPPGIAQAPASTPAEALYYMINNELLFLKTVKREADVLLLELNDVVLRDDGLLFFKGVEQSASS